MFAMMKRGLVVALGALALAGCQVIPDSGQPVEGPSSAPVKQTPDAAVLPQDDTRHRVALLVPLSGRAADVGQSIANATTMALLDTGAQDLRITTYDTAAGAGSAAARAISDGNKLILGPLRRENVGAILAQARPANVPLITFSNDVGVARPDVLVMGYIPEQSISRTINFAIDQGARNFAALAPRSEYGNRALAALQQALASRGATLVVTERFDRGNTSIISAASRLDTRGGFDTVLIADGARLATMAASELKEAGEVLPSIIGTELWSREMDITRAAAMRGAWFSAVPDNRYEQFAESYRSRFGQQPHRIAALGYDSVLMTLRVARDWQVGADFPTSVMYSDGGFLGVDGVFRFGNNGVGQRAMEVRQVDNGSISTVSNAPTQF